MIDGIVAILKSKLIIMILLLQFVAAKGSNKAVLEIRIRDCRFQEFAYLEKIILFKDGVIIKELFPEHHHIQIINDIELGTYSLEYKSIFNKTEKVKVTISEYKKYNIDLCVEQIDYSTAKYKPILDRLKNNERYQILMYSHGCFHHNKDTLTVSRKGNTYIAKLGLESKILEKSDIDAIRHFEIEFNCIKSEEGCTTVDEYKIVYRLKRKKLKDGSCSWCGYYFLKNQLFKEKD